MSIMNTRLLEDLPYALVSYGGCIDSQGIVTSCALEPSQCLGGTFVPAHDLETPLQCDPPAQQSYSACYYEDEGVDYAFGVYDPADCPNNGQVVAVPDPLSELGQAFYCDYVMTGACQYDDELVCAVSAEACGENASFVPVLDLWDVQECFLCNDGDYHADDNANMNGADDEYKNGMDGDDNMMGEEDDEYMNGMDDVVGGDDDEYAADDEYPIDTQEDQPGACFLGDSFIGYVLSSRDCGEGETFVVEEEHNDDEYDDFVDVKDDDVPLFDDEYSEFNDGDGVQDGVTDDFVVVDDDTPSEDDEYKYIKDDDDKGDGYDTATDDDDEALLFEDDTVNGMDDDEGYSDTPVEVASPVREQDISTSDGDKKHSFKPYAIGILTIAAVFFLWKQFSSNCRGYRKVNEKKLTMSMDAKWKKGEVV